MQGVTKASDNIYINRVSGEVLIYPEEETDRVKGEICEDKFFYARWDMAKLEIFNKAEQRSGVAVIKKKCLEHSKKC